MKIFVLTAAALVASGSLAQAMTGTDVAALCAGDRRVAQAYVAGLADAFTDPGLPKQNFCILKATDVQLTDAFCRFLEKRPERFLPAGVLAHRGFAEAFPCDR